MFVFIHVSVYKMSAKQRLAVYGTPEYNCIYLLMNAAILQLPLEQINKQKAKAAEWADHQFMQP